MVLNPETRSEFCGSEFFMLLTAVAKSHRLQPAGLLNAEALY